MKKLASAVALAAAALCSTAPAHAEIVVSFTPSSSTINVGETATITMSISGLGNEILAGWDFNVLWNSSVVSLSNAATATDPGCGQLASAMFAGDCVTDKNLAGEFGSQATALDDDDSVAALQTDDGFVIAEFKFVGLNAGSTDVTLGASLLYDRNFLGRGYNPSLDVARFEFANICVRSDLGSTLPGQSCDNTPPGVPEPASYALAGVALLAAGWAGRSRRRTVKAA